jgi:hypothetical protein
MFGNESEQTSEEREERARITQGQRRINVIWEYTQAAIALCVVLGNLIVGVHLGLFHDGANTMTPPVLSNSLFLVVGFYFGRTNHASVGGIGRKEKDVYRGR